MTDIVAGHILPNHHHHHFRIWKDGVVVVDVIGNVANFGARDDIKAHLRCIGGSTEDGSGEEKNFVLFFWLSIGLFFHPAWAFSVIMPIIAISALKRLSSIRNLPLMAFLSIVAVPYLMAFNMFVAEFNENFPLAVEEVRASMLSPLCRLEYDGALRLEMGVKIGVRDLGHLAVTCPVDGGPNRTSMFPFLLERYFNLFSIFLDRELEIG